MKSLSSLLVALVATLAAPSCMYVATDGALGAVLDPARLASIEEGTTTKKEVLERLGPPGEYIRSEVLDSLLDEEVRIAGALQLGNQAHDAFTYQFERLRFRGTYLLLYGGFWATVDSDLVLILFDENDVVREVSIRRKATDA